MRIRISLDRSARLPLYQQISDGIKDAIATGELSEESRLPSVRELAASLEVNLNTVAAAYRLLQEEGLLEVRHGIGARIVSSTSGDATVTELRKMLRATLGRLTLSGLDRGEIDAMVSTELRRIFKSRPA